MEEFFTLKSKGNTLAFKRYRTKYAFAYLGKSFACDEDIRSLDYLAWTYGTSPRYNIGLTYPVFGDDTLDRCPSEDVPAAGMDAYGALAVTHADGLTATLLDVVSVKREKGEGSETVIIEMKDRSHDFYVTQFFKAYDDCDPFETWVVLRNEEDGAVRLPRMDSFAMYQNGKGNGAELFSLTGHWGAEAQLSRTKIGVGASAAIESRDGVHSAWESNPAFMVAFGDSTETSGSVFGGALAWTGAWHGHVSVVHNGCVGIHSGTTNPSDAYVLDSGKSITLPKFIFTWSDEGRGKVSRDLHRWARNHALPHGKEIRPVLLNSWEGTYFDFTEKTLTDMMDGVKDFGGEMFVLDDGWFGRGEFARNGDKTGLGDWYWNYEKLPMGPGYVAEEAKKRGLRFGLWFEPEMANSRSELVTKHPDWVIQDPGKELRMGRGYTQLVLDLCNPAVRDEIYNQIDALLTEVPGITYIKWDANAAFMNAGSKYLDKEHQANLWFDYSQGYYELAMRLAKKHPHVFFQACASGGGHMDYGTLSSYADEVWGSDNTDAAQRLQIQWGSMQFYPANTIACHVTASPNHQTGRTFPIKYRFDVAMGGRLGFELHPGNIEDKSEIPYIREFVETYKRIRPTIQQGDLYRLASPYDSDWESIMYVSEDKKHAILFFYGISRGIGRNFLPFVQLEGLDPNMRYKATELNVIGGNIHGDFNGKVIGGDALMSRGVAVRIGAGYDSAVFEFIAQ